MCYDSLVLQRRLRCWYVFLVIGNLRAVYFAGLWDSNTERITTRSLMPGSLRVSTSFELIKRDWLPPFKMHRVTLLVSVGPTIRTQAVCRCV